MKEKNNKMKYKSWKQKKNKFDDAHKNENDDDPNKQCARDIFSHLKDLIEDVFGKI